jgi:diguanylate cyclase (GGDEF)-like protein/putative nucleotidyltransferase with HDIG domain
VATAKQMNLDKTDLEGVNTGALLHDIGKLGVPEYVLLKPGRLTAEEFAKIKQHPSIGAAILSPVTFPWPVLSVVKHHHEKWDGSGYPDGLKGEEIPMPARILAVADVYDAVTSNRSYRTAWTHERAIAHIKKLAGTHLDATVVEAFLEVIDGVRAEMALEDQSQLAPSTEASDSPAIQATEAAYQIQQTSIELFALYEVAQTLSCSLGLTETLHILAWKLESIFPGTTCVFMLRDDQDRLRARSIVGVNHEFFRGASPLSENSPTARVVRDHQTYLGSYDPDDLLLTSTPTAQWTPLNVSLIVPIIHQNMTLGTINFYHTEAQAFTIHVRHLLETIAERAAMPIYNGMLFDRTRSSAITDPLTGLYNIRHLTEQVQERIRQIQHYRKPDGQQHVLPEGIQAIVPGDIPIRESDRFAILCLDLDSFKAINDNFGHQRGDRVLRDVSTIFMSMARASDLVARYGGDEFVILVDGVGTDEARTLADRLQSAVEAYDVGLVHERLGTLKLGISIGIASYPEDGEEWQDLFAVADRHMYHNKTDRKLGRLIEHAQSQSDTAAA